MLFRFAFSRVTSDKTAEMIDITYIRIADLDKSRCNKIIMEHSSEGYVNDFECPHHIIKCLIRIVGEFIRQARLDEEPAVLQKPVDNKKLLEEYHEGLMKELMNIKEEIKELKSKL